MASGDTLFSAGPLSSEPPASNYATIDTRNNHPVLDFDAATEESTMFTTTMPRNYSGNGITVSIRWAATSATTGGTVWGVAVERVTGGQDIDSDGFATEVVSGTSTAPGTSGVEQVVEVALSNAQIDSVVVGDTLRMKIARKVGAAGDDMAGDAELIAVEVRET